VHPILQSIRRLLLYLGSCSLVAGLLAVVYASVSGAPLEEAASVVIPLALVYAFMCLSAWYVCLATPLDARNWARVLYAQTGSAALAVAIWAVFWEGWTRLLLPIFDQSVSHYREQSVLIVATGVLLFWLASMFHYLLIALEESRRRETRELGLEVLAREAELKALRAQIDPHFLFNSLHSISALTASDPAGARRMCLLLADFFRSSVRLGVQDDVALADELAMVRQYLEIERVRCGDRLQVSVDFAAACETCRIPPLILQPLVENAVRHGINSLVDGGTVAVTASCAAGRLTMAVANPVSGDAPRRSGAGVGLSNVKRRLSALFGAEARTEVTGEPGLFRVELHLPCRSPARAGREVDA
jgi:sensor histidine kinase YesM